MARPPFPDGSGDGAEALPDPLRSLLPRLVAALPGPLLVLDRQERIALASPAAEEMFGSAPDGMVGVHVGQLFPDGCDGGPARAWGACGRTLCLDVARRRLTHGGEELTLLWLENATERRRSEESLRNDVAHLERTTRAKSDFVATVSHEIRTPMNAVLGMTDILLESGLDDGQRELAERVRRAGLNLLQTLNDVLDLTKVEAGQLELSPSCFRLRPWLDEVTELFQTQAAEKGIALESAIGRGVPETVHGDAPRLRQVLVNLIGNAMKFTHAGRVEVRIELCETPGRITFAVRDTGIGIEPADLDQLFEPWRQARASAHLGSGLGLAIARQLVQQMGGSIAAESVRGEGSEFRFVVPLEIRPAPHREPAPFPLDPRDSRSHRLA